MRAGPPVAAAALAAALLAGGGGSASATPAAAPRYSALEGTGPTGLALIDPDRPPPPGEGAQPSLPLRPPAGDEDWPVVSSIRRLALDRDGLSAWIARSSQGGVCVLLYDGVPIDGVAAVYVGCAGSESAAQGTSVEVSRIPGMPGRVITAGVVPDGVSSVSEQMADGSIATSTVSGNAWARVSDLPAAAGAQPTDNAGG